MLAYIDILNIQNQQIIDLKKEN